MNDQLKAAMAATVRVGDGSGVVLAAAKGNVSVIATANHVVVDDLVRVAWPGGQSAVAVVARDPERDVALIATPRPLETRGIILAAMPDIAECGWLLGFPGGWDGADPVISRCTISGLRPNTGWVDGAASWGHSGGPVIVVRESVPVVAGIILGDPGKVHESLAEMSRSVNREIELLRGALASRFKRGLGRDADLISAIGERGWFATTLEMIKTHFRAGFVEIAFGRHVAALRGD